MAPLVWLITGSSSGFGQEIAVQALERGDKVIAAARDVSKLEKLKEVGAEVIALDVTSDAILLKETASTAHGFYGKIDILVNCAGYNAAGVVEECSPDEVLASFNTNVFGLMAVTRAIIPYMRAQKSGTIANFSSTMAWTGAGGQALYSGVKAATSVISECLSAELKPWNISVISIEPGSFRTDFLAGGHLTLPKAPLKEYDGTPARQVIEYMGYFDGKQPGEVVKGSRIVVDVLTKSGSAVGREIPMRLALGPDAYDTIKGKCEQTMVLLDEWKVISTATNHADVEGP
ncbi:retinol dehydrogenase 8 [Truncatella angustata]|uniref:Retinol dehydrogenase 8 n=1 Tax=Truncatella angustata TaxID=152316 RepID=A0A9P8UC07_9PEZI|nr:retinol dehydrogenase 8 [Truncatella angustata]KAH6645575.1 retinol dehydrogenase 8 [Truncatella angustata]